MLHCFTVSNSSCMIFEPRLTCSPIPTLMQGQKERDQCYKPILEELNSLFPDRSSERYIISLYCVFHFGNAISFLVIVK